MKLIKIGRTVINAEDISFVLENVQRNWEPSSLIYFRGRKDPIMVSRFPIEIKFLLENGKELPMTDERKKQEDILNSVSKKLKDYNENFFRMETRERNDGSKYLTEVINARNALEDYLEKEYVEYSGKETENDKGENDK